MTMDGVMGGRGIGWCKDESEEIVDYFGRLWKFYCLSLGFTNSILFF